MIWLVDRNSKHGLLKKLIIIILIEYSLPPLQTKLQIMNRINYQKTLIKKNKSTKIILVLLATNKNQKYCRIFCHHPKSHPQNNPYPKRETHNPLPHCAYLRPCACLLRTSRERDNRGKGKREIMAMAMAFRRLSSSVDKPIKRGGSLYYMVSSLFYAYVVLPLFMQGNLVFLSLSYGWYM